MRRSRWIRHGFGIMAAVTILTLFALSPTASAGVIREDRGDTDWEILFAPYLWATSLRGTSQVGALPPMDVDASFSDLFSNLNMALALHTEFHRGKFAFVIDPTYLSLEMDVESPADPIQVSADAEIWLVEFWAAYKVSDNWEILGGGRWQQHDLEVDPGLPSPPFPDATFGVKEDWTDWFLGLRFNYPIGQSRWLVTGRGDVKVAGDSDNSFNVEVFFNRRIRQTMALNIGYRYFEVDYDNFPVYAWDARQQGPVIGYTWSF